MQFFLDFEKPLVELDQKILHILLYIRKNFQSIIFVI